MSRGWRLPAALAAVILGAGEAAGRSLQEQSGLEILVNLQQERYDTAAARHAAARDSLNAVDARFTDALMSLQGARSTGDAGRQEAAYTSALVPGREMTAQLARFGAAVDTLLSAHADLVEALWHWQEAVLDMIDTSSPGPDRARLQEEFQRTRERIGELEAAQLPEEGGSPMSDLAIVEEDPRDGPVEWRFKASLCRRLAAEADQLLEDMNSDLNQLTVRQTRERQREDFLIDTDRFTRDTRPPTVVRQPGQLPVTDTLAAGRAPETLEERIEDLRRQIANLEEYRDRILERAEHFDSLRGGGAR